MNQQTAIQTPKPFTHISPVNHGLLQRKCACGQHTGSGGECEECKKKRLQRRAANQAEPADVPSIVHEVLRSPGQPLDAETQAFMESRFGHDFSRMRVSATTPQIAQAGLTVGPVNDPFEQEADRVAEVVMQGSRQSVLNLSAPCAPYDFSQVRVHTDARAAESARAVNALAYTVGRDVVFGAGQYVPKTAASKSLLAHELTHVVQQSGAAGASAQRLSVDNTADDHSEREANDQANRLAQGQATGPPLVSAQFGSRILQRQADISQAPPDVGNCLLVAGSGHPLGLNYLFEQSRSTVSPPDQADLADFAHLWLEDDAQPEVNVHGYASVEGTQAFNWRLSCARAEAVKAVLMHSGVPEGRIFTIAHGESTEFSTAGLAENRRVIVNTVQRDQPAKRQRRAYPKVRVWVNSFIPHDRVEGPPLHDCFAGDNRGFSSNPNASSRTHQLAEVTPGQDSLTTSIRRIGTTHEVDCDTGAVLDSGRASEDELSNGAILGQRSTAQADVFLNASASNPLVTGAPAIDLEAEFHLNLVTRTCIFEMDHDGFPGYEAYISADGEPTITLYTYDPRDHGETIIDLFPPMDWTTLKRISF